jgi:hypothetical protein
MKETSSLPDFPVSSQTEGAMSRPSRLAPRRASRAGMLDALR